MTPAQHASNVLMRLPVYLRSDAMHEQIARGIGEALLEERAKRARVVAIARRVLRRLHALRTEFDDMRDRYTVLLRDERAAQRTIAEMHIERGRAR